MAEKDNDSELNEQKPDRIEKKTKAAKIKSILLELSLYVIIFVVCTLILPRYVYCRNEVSGSSMYNTLINGDQLITDKISYELGDPKRFDVVVLEPHAMYSTDPDELYVKRVIGMPGETIEIKGNDIFINDKKLDEHYGYEEMYENGYYAKRQLGDDEYFVMGDNRNNSRDSRDDTVGPIKRKNIKGKVVLRIWPLKSFSLVK